jgi:hypothetical protein
VLLRQLDFDITDSHDLVALNAYGTPVGWFATFINDVAF